MEKEWDYKAAWELLREKIEENAGVINIVTHVDPDGVLASAIVVKVLEGAGFDDIAIFFERPSSIQRKKSPILDPSSEDFLGGVIIILDLPYSDVAHVWIDHHASENETVPGPATVFHILDTRHSAAKLADREFRRLAGLEANVVDQGFLEFVNARDIGLKPPVIKREYEMICDAINDDRRDFNFLNDLIFMLVDKPLPEIVKNPVVMQKAKKQAKKRKRGLKALDNIVLSENFDDFIKTIDVESDKPYDDESKARLFLYNGFLFFDLSDLDTSEKEASHGVYLPYYTLGPELEDRGLDYSYMLVFYSDKKDGSIHCTISVNQQKDSTKDVDVSEFAKAHGGGGHRFVAGFDIEPASFLETIKEVVEFLPLGDSPEGRRGEKT